MDAGQLISPLKAWLADPARRVGLVLAALSIGFFVFVSEWPLPWEDEAVRAVGMRLKVLSKEVPREIFRDFSKLGELNIGTEAYIQIGLWYGGLFAGVSLAIAALTAPWWVPLARRRPQSGAVIVSSVLDTLWKVKKTDWLVLGAILLSAVALRAPHLDRAIYFDEQDNLRRNFHGHVEVRPDGQRIWREAAWSDALWENRLGNNPVLLSVATQASLRTWRLFTGADPERFNIVVLRVPVFVAGLASIAAIWWLLQLWGLRFGAALGAALAAVHPMHIDYSLQARGYAFVLLFVPLALGFAWTSLRRDRWRDWIGFAAAVFCCLWSYAGSFHFALTLNVGILAFLLWRRRQSQDPGATGTILRMLSVNAGSGLLYAFLIFPHLPQVSYHFKEVFELIALEPYWFFYAWSHYSTGTSFPLHPDIGALREGSASLPDVLVNNVALAEPILATLQWVIIPALMTVGLVWLSRGKPTVAKPATLVLSLALIAPVLALIHQQFTSLYFYYWYLSYALPAVIAAIAAGFHGLLRPLLQREAPLPRAITIAASGAFLFLFVWQSHHFTGRAGRISQVSEWPVTQDGLKATEFRRGQSLWITTRDGQSICLKDKFEDETGQRAGR